MTPLALLFSTAVAAATPSDATVVYYNARMALREDQPDEAVRLWLLRNALESQQHRVSPEDADFRSVTWVALGDLGLCTDGLRPDDDGVGIWPLAVYNLVVQTFGRRPRPRTGEPFQAFAVGRQQRPVAIGDVLDQEELLAVQLSRGRCLRPYLEQLHARQTWRPHPKDRQVGGWMLRHLLVKALETVDRVRVRGVSVLDARLFDVDLQLTALANRAARREAQERSRKGRAMGLSVASLRLMLEQARKTTLPPESDAIRILNACPTWPVEEWMALTDDRRRFLFDHARAVAADSAPLEQVALGIVDAEIRAGNGAAVMAWISRVNDRAAVAMGERGARLLGLDASSGFTEASVVALWRATHFVASGDLAAAMQSFAFAVAHAHESVVAAEVSALSRRWLSYVTGQFVLDASLIQTLQALLPKRERAHVFEDLAWQAAAHRDAVSFAHAVEALSAGAAARLDLVQPLAAGDVGGFQRRLREGMNTSPTTSLRDIDLLLTILERDSAEVRRDHSTTLDVVVASVQPLAEEGDLGGRNARTAAAVIERVRAMQEGLQALDAAAADIRTRALSPESGVFVGSVKLAPTDALPWPFVDGTPTPPSVFEPLSIEPVEWRDARGEWVFGWSIRG